MSILYKKFSHGVSEPLSFDSGDKEKLISGLANFGSFSSKFDGDLKFSRDFVQGLFWAGLLKGFNFLICQKPLKGQLSSDLPIRFQE